MKSDKFEDGEQALLIDQRGRRHLLLLRKGETFHSDRGWVTHDAIIGHPDGSWVRTSKGTRYLALRPTLAEYVLDMPRGAQVIYPKDLAMVMFWADIFPGARVLEAGMGSGALTLALLRAVGPEGRVVSYEQREDFCRRALANIQMRLGEVTNLIVRIRPVEDGLAEEEPVDRAVFDLPEPWRLVEPVASVLRPGGIFLSYVPTIIQSHQLTETLRRHRGYALVETFETLLRPWNIDGTSVRPFHRMVAHTGFLTVARRVVPEEGASSAPRIADPETGRVLPQGEVGGIEIRGPNVFKGYWRMPEKTKEEFRPDGFFVSGDLGRIDERGYIAIVGRAKDLIISGGFNVYPAEVEAIIEALPGVAECAVIGVPHADFGEAVVAVVTAKAGAALEEKTIQAALANELAKFKQPKKVFVTTELPRNAMGKVQKKDLRAEHAKTFTT